MLYAAPRPKKQQIVGADAQQPKPRARSIPSEAAPGDSEKDYIVFKLIRERHFALNGCHSIAADASTRRRYACLATVTSAWLLESFRQAPSSKATADARAIRDALRKAGYTSRALGARVLGGTPVAAAAAPTQVLRRTEAGKAPPRDDEVDALIALFALGLSVEKGELSAATYDAVAPLLAEDMTARCMVAPVGALRDAGDDLYLLTDWPPEKRLTKEEPCMYLGPDSLALADLASSLAAGKRVADLCAGSGIQGLVATRAGAASIRWVEAEARAAAFCRLNGALNCVEGDVVVDRVSNVEAGTYDLILANPPYVATPPSLEYDAFAAGGPDGYDVLKDVVTYASKHLAEDGLLAVVFELNGPPEALFAKVALAWASGGAMNARCAVVHDLLTERTAPEAVAERRGGGQSDAWLANYRDQNVDRVANAVLLLGRTSGGGFDWAEGACARAWAPPPTNGEARAAVDQALRRVRG
jgi:hypothetical protein